LETGRGALDGADLLREAPTTYKSDVEYPEDNPIAQSLKGISQVMSAELGTRIYYAAHGSFDTHTNELVNHALLWDQLSAAVSCFMDDLKQQGKQDETVIWMFSEFGRRIADNGLSDQLEGDVRFNTDFRQIYATLLEDVLGVESEPVLKQKFSKLDLVRS
jgi:uncharacterized protein (DUF1501 family)